MPGPLEWLLERLRALADWLLGGPTVALSIASQGNSGVTATGATRSVAGISWSAGDIVVVIGVTENGGHPFGTPTGGPAAFTAAASYNGGTGFCGIQIWTATATGAGSGTISATIGSTTFGAVLNVWTVTGGPTGVTAAQADGTNAADSKTPAAGDVVLYAHGDWNAAAAGKTGLTPSGTFTERVDAAASGLYTAWAGDWVGVSAGTASFGITSYSGLACSVGSIIVQAPVASGTDANAGHAAGTGAAANATTAVRPSAGHAAGTGAAANAAANVRPTASSAAGTGVAHAAALALGLLAGAATGVGAAHPAAAAVAPVVGHAAGTGAAYDATVRVAPGAGHAAGTGAAYNATIIVAVPAGHAAGTGEALDASTTSGGGATNVDAGHAAGTGDAYDAQVSPGLWQTVTNDFTDAPGDNFLASGTVPPYVDGRAAFDAGASDGGLNDFTDRSLDGSYAHVKAQPNPSYGYLEFQLTRSAGGTLVASIYKRADQTTLGIYHNGSTVATPTYDPVAMRWWRYRATGTTLAVETSPDTVTWTEQWSGTSPFDLTTVEVVLNGGNAVGGSAPTTGAEFGYFSRFNLPDIDAYPAAGAAAGTGTAHDPAATVAPVVGHAAGTGAAYNAAVIVAPGAGHAAGTGAAYFDVGSQVSLDLVQDTPTAGTGEAYDATSSVAPTAATATGTGAAYDATVSTSSPGTASAEAALGTGAAHQAAATVAPAAGHAAGTGAAYDATVTTAGVGTAPAQPAAGTGAAHDPGVSATPRSVATATGTGQAFDATVSTASTATAPAGHASGVGAAYDAVVRVDVRPSTATGTGAAYDASGPAAFAITSPVRARIDPSSGVRAVIADTSGVRARIHTT